jgi:predicted 2-oxoglutarate/Fe(II)-dependent dioxygenase YbiX
MERLHTYENFLTIEECESILKKYRNELELKPGLVGSNDANARKSSVAFIDNIDIIDDKLKECLRNLIRVKGFEVTGLGPYQFTEYKTGEYYDWHTDSIKTGETKNRFVSIVIQLNDEYEGGYLQIKDESGDNTIQLDKGTGTMYIFFSNLRHRVMKVTSGTRYSLVNWVSLKKLEDFKNTLI